MEKPKLIDNPDLEELKKLCDEYINYLSSPDYNEDDENDYTHYIYESAMKAIFGENVFDYINERI